MAVITSDKEAGFTLVEMLCVLALLGLTAGLVVLNLPKPAAPFQQEVRGATTILNLAARASIIDGKSRGVDFTTGDMEVFHYDGEWISEVQHEFLNLHGLNLRIEQQEIDLSARTKLKEKSDLPPLIYFDATGNVTPFTLSLKGRDDSFLLEPDPRGRIVMVAEP